MPKARIKSKLPIEIVVSADERHHTSVRKPRTHAYRRASEAPVSARAVAVIRPVPIIIALPLFLCTLSGKRQLHAYQYLSGGRVTFRIAEAPRLSRNVTSAGSDCDRLSATRAILHSTNTQGGRYSSSG